MSLDPCVLAHITVPAAATSLRLLRSVVGRTGELVGADPELVERLVLAVNEAGMNVIQHAYPKDAPGDLELEIRRVDDELVFVLIDHAPPVSPDNIQAQTPGQLRPGGLGVHFIREIMDRVDYGHLDSGIGNRLEMRKRIPAAD